MIQVKCKQPHFGHAMCVATRVFTNALLGILDGSQSSHIVRELFHYEFFHDYALISMNDSMSDDQLSLYAGDRVFTDRKDDDDAKEVFDTLVPMYFSIMRSSSPSALIETIDDLRLPSLLSLSLLTYVSSADLISMKITDRAAFDAMKTSFSIM